LDGLSITKAVKILKKRYEGSRLTKVTVTEDSVCLGVYSKERVSILVRITGGKPSVHPVFKQVGVPDQALDRLNGGTITDVGGRKYDRIIFIDVEKRRPSGKIERNRLVFELIGKMGNAMMVNSEGMINWTFCKNNPDADRAMGVGQSYQLPKSNKRQTLEEYSSEDFSDLLGFYPVTVKHAGKYMEANYSFAEVAVLIKEYLEDEEFYLDTAGKLLPFKPLENGEPVSFDSIAELSDKTAQKRRDDGIKLRLERYFEKQLQRYKGLKVKLETELKAAEQHEETLKRAELIKSNIYKLKGRKGIVELDDYTEDEIRKVPYDIPDDFDVNGELERLYKKAEKLKRSLPLIKERIKEIDNIVDSAQEQLYFISISASDDELRELSAEMRKSEAVY